LRPLEVAIYRVSGIREDQEMPWYAYAFAVLAFHLVGLAFLYVLLRTQQWLPLNPQHFGPLSPDLAWNTAVSFTTNTNWQFYSGESTMSYLSQMAGLAWHNFVSAAAGIAIAVAVIRGVTRTTTKSLGSFWVDMTRAVLYVLLPVSIVAGLLLVSQGVPQNFHAYQQVRSIEGFSQTITGGPIASQESIKELGTNGGGFVNANSASPNENPTPFTDWLELFLILIIPAGLVYMYGRMVKNVKHGWAIFAAMSILLITGFGLAYWAEGAGNPLVHHLGVLGGNMEGKETRFGIAASALFATVTTATSCGAVNAMHDSFTALGGLIPLVNMQLGEIVFGGVGSGLYSMIVFVVLTVFIAGLMVGRTPEYLGKKIERREVQFAILAILVTPVLCLIPTALAASIPAGLATLNNSGPHGFSEILYAYTSGNANNGSAFAGLSPNLFYNVTMGINMLFGRFIEAIPTLALAGALVGKTAVPESAGTFTTHSPIFVVLLLGVIVIVGALTFLPADALGPIVEHLLIQQGKTF
jgi:potassium-transporting ATPase potassium-binding subunit